MAQVTIMVRPGWVFCQHSTSALFPNRYRCNWVGLVLDAKAHEAKEHRAALRAAFYVDGETRPDGTSVAVYPTIVHFPVDYVRRTWNSASVSRRQLGEDYPEESRVVRRETYIRDRVLGGDHG